MCCALHNGCLHRTLQCNLSPSPLQLDRRIVCRAWQLFDWVRALPEDHALRVLCDEGTYTTMITLCGTWQQLRRALELVDDMRSRSLDCGLQVCYHASQSKQRQICMHNL